MNSKKNKTVINIPKYCLLFILFAVLFISIGFSAFDNKIVATDLGATVRIKADIRISSLSISSLTGSALSIGEDYNISSISSQINLPNADSKVEYNIGVTNFGNVEMGLNKITGLPSNLAYEIVGYKEGSEKFCEGDACSLGVTDNFKLVLKYKDGAYNASNTEFDVNLDFDFEYFLNVSYEDSMANKVSANSPREAMYSGVYEATLENGDRDCVNLIYAGATLTYGDKYTNSDGSITSFTIDNKIIRVENPRSDLVFKYVPRSEIVAEDDVKNKELGISVDWHDDGDIIVTLNGTASADTYIRLRAGDVAIANTTSILYKQEYATNPLFKKGNNVYVRYDYLDGDVSGITETFTIKFRDTSKTSKAIDDAAHITNHAKKNFEITEKDEKTAVLTTNVSEISVFSSAGNTFDNFRFKIHYGYVGE